ncbi:unnamed protein product, partial [Cyprideis torosa]
MTSLLILKAVYNLSHEVLVEQHWEMNAYFQYFGGVSVQQWSRPCAANDLVHFRQRIGEQGLEKILKQSIDKHGKDGKDPNVSIDTSAQEKNIAYPTDAKLHKKIIDKCAKMAKENGIKLRRSYKRKLKTIAGRLFRELGSKLPDGACAAELETFKKVLAQQKNSKNKIYSLHEPEAYCMSKGKAHKKYEYGCKASVVLTQKTGIIFGAMTFKNNVYNGHILEDVLAQTKGLTGKAPKTATVDRGYKGKQRLGATQVNVPKPPLKKDSDHQKRKKRKHFRGKAAVEPIIGHLKQDHRAPKNFLKEQIGDSINFVMAAAGFNFKKLMAKLKDQALWLYLEIQNMIAGTFCCRGKGFSIDPIPENGLAISIDREKCTYP